MQTSPESEILFPGPLFDYERFEHQGLFDGINYVWEALTQLEDYIATYLAKSRSKSRQGNRADITPGAIVGTDVVLGEDVVIEPHVYIKGPAIVGDRTLIRHGAYIRENVIIGKECVIGHSSEIKHSILMDGAKASHWNYVGDSIVGFRVNLGAGVKLSNQKITGTEIAICDLEGKTYATGLQKLGGIIGDETQIGCNAVLNPGTLLGKRCLVYPLVSVRKTHSHNQIIRS